MLTGFTVVQARFKENISCRKAAKLIQKHIQDTNFVILDVRTPEEFKNGHIEKAIIIDFKSADFQDRISLLNKNKKYLVYCRGGGRSSKSIGIMKNLKFNKLYNLYEGYETWKKDGYKTVTD